MILRPVVYLFLAILGFAVLLLVPILIARRIVWLIRRDRNLQTQIDDLKRELEEGQGERG